MENQLMSEYVKYTNIININILNLIDVLIVYGAAILCSQTRFFMHPCVNQIISLVFLLPDASTEQLDEFFSSVTAQFAPVVQNCRQ